jgi:signal transduction histidine kinase
MIVHKLLPLIALGLNLLLLGSALAPDRRSQRNLRFAYLATALAVWNLGVFGLRATADPDIALVWQRVLHVGVIPIPVLFYHYVLAFLDLPRRRRPALIVGYVLCGVFLAAWPTPAFLRGVTESTWGFMPAAGPLYAPFFVYFQSYLVLGLVRLVRAYGSQSSSFKRNRTLLVIMGAEVSLLGGIVDIIRFMLSWDWLYPIGIPSNAVFALALGVAIVRYRLMDVGVLAKRIVLYLLTSAALAPILFLGLWGLDQMALGRPSETMPADGLGTLTWNAVILLLVFTVALPLLRKLEGGLQRLMFRRRHGVRDALVRLIKELGSLLEIGALARTLTEGLVTRIPVLSGGLYRYDAATSRFTRLARATSDAGDAPVTSPVLDKTLALWLGMTGRTLIVEETSFRGGAYARMRPVVEQLERERVALVVPLFMEGEVAAVLVVGEKLSGEIFDSDEVELLEMLAGETVIALKNAGLYQDLQSRMAELQRTQETLVESAKLAAVGELAASVAHEINTPLMVILGNSNLLLKQLPSDSPASGKVSIIETEAHRAGKIVRDLLNFARRREPRREQLSIHELLDRAIDLLGPKLAFGHVEVERVFDLSLPAIAGDRDQLTQVFLNLITNAMDAMGSGGRVVLQTGMHQGDDGRTMVSVSVSDTGHGIPPEHRGRIFEPFYTTKSEGRGTGLGLSVSLGIVQMHGGSIEVDSKVGHGTTMRVTVPVW